ncbi:hypothetical protein ACXR2W_00810 [Leucobacter sp. HY1908]
MAKKFMYRVCGAAVVLRRADKSEAYLYKGAMIPSGFTEESIKHGIAVGLVERVEVADPAADAAAAKAAADAKAAAEAKAKAEAAEKAKQDAAAKAAATK